MTRASSPRPSRWSRTPGPPTSTSFTAKAEDNEGSEASDTDDATVRFTDVEPVVEVVKDADKTSVDETGEDVVFTFTVTNESAESVEITELTDSDFGTLAGDADCEVGTVLAASGEPGDSCSFSITREIKGDASGPDHENTFTAEVEDNDGSTDEDSDDQTVGLDDVPPTIVVTKTADPTAVPETGGDVTFTFEVENTSEESVEITELSEDVYGPLTGDADCAVGTVLAAGASCEFSITREVSGDHSGPDHVNVFTAKAEDNDGTEAEDSDDATVDFTDVAPAIEVTKTANPTEVPETGGDVTFTFEVENTSTEEAVVITSLVDDVYGTLDGDEDCELGTVLQAGESCEFSITELVEGDAAGPDHVDVFTAKAEDNDETEAEDSDDATVEYTDVKPTVEVVKDADKTSVDETGEDVVFTFTVTNESAESVEITEPERLGVRRRWTVTRTARSARCWRPVASRVTRAPSRSPVRSRVTPRGRTTRTRSPLRSRTTTAARTRTPTTRPSGWTTCRRWSRSSRTPTRPRWTRPVRTWCSRSR